MGRYLELVRGAIFENEAVAEEDRLYDRNDLNDKSPTEDTSRPIQRAVVLHVPEEVPETWAQGVADLLVMPPHPAWTDDGWTVLQDDALRFLREWAAQAHSLGWEALDLFGVHPHRANREARLCGLGAASEGPPGGGSHGR